MAVRTTTDAVRAIIEVDDTIDLTPFIEAANALVTEVCASVETYDNTRLELIERWLSAHVYTVREGRAVSESVKGVGQTVQSYVGPNLATSHYGQQAMMLDTAGGLANLSVMLAEGKKKQKVSVTWLGSRRYGRC